MLSQEAQGLRELGGGTESDFQEARVKLSPKARGVRPREEGHSKPHLELAPLGSGPG